jgi:hypothetical protein
MNYLLFIGSTGKKAPEDLALLQREVPGWVQEMDGRGVRLLGRELELPETAATVRVRDGETLVSDGPFAETKEFVAGFDLLDCADLDEALEVAAKHPTSWVDMTEVRPFKQGLELGERARAFAREDDSAGPPYVLLTWTDAAAPFDDRAVMDASDAWRQDLEARGLHVLGGSLEGADTATTVRVRGEATQLSDGPLVDAEQFIESIEVISCADRQQAIAVAAAHPLARYHAIEVRPFYSG